MAFETSVGLALQIPATTYDILDSRSKLWLEAIVHGLQIQELYTFLVLLTLNDIDGFHHISVQGYLIRIVAYTTSTKSFFLEDKSLIQHLTTLLGADAKVEIFHLRVTLGDKMTEEQIERSPFPSFVTSRDILDVGHLFAYEHHAARHDTLFVFHQEDLYLLGETGHKQRYLGLTMHGRDAMMTGQHISKQLPILMQSFFVPVHQTLDVQVMVDSLFGLTHSQGAHLQRRPQHYHRTHRT